MISDSCHCELDSILHLDSKGLFKIPILSLYLITDAISCSEIFLLIALGDPGTEKPSVPEATKTQPEVCLRLEVGPNAAVHSPLAVQNGFLHMLVHSYTAEFFMSFLTNLGPFLEDEIIPEVIPMEIEVVDAKITLKVRGSPQVGSLGRGHLQDPAWEGMLWDCCGPLQRSCFPDTVLFHV